MSFKSGALLPEELIEEVCKIIKKESVKRIAFIDLKSIGTSYPFLVESPTSGSLFLSAFVHIMRNYGVHVIMTSSNSQQAISQEQLFNARILSDASFEIVSKNNKELCEKREVFIVGEGLVVNEKFANIYVNKKSANNGKEICFKFTDKSKPKSNPEYSAPLFPFEIVCNDCYNTIEGQ